MFSPMYARDKRHRLDATGAQLPHRRRRPEGAESNRHGHCEHWEHSPATGRRIFDIGDMKLPKLPAPTGRNPGLRSGAHPSLPAPTGRNPGHRCGVRSARRSHRIRRVSGLSSVIFVIFRRALFGSPSPPSPSSKAPGLIFPRRSATGPPSGAKAVPFRPVQLFGAIARWRCHRLGNRDRKIT
jgi:hypothetical protein